MKNLVTLVALAVIGLCIWKFHTNQVSAAAEKAAQEARARTLAALPKNEPKAPKPAPKQAIAVSRMLDRWYVSLFSTLNRQMPEDLVPPLTVARERILDAKPLVEPDKRPIYDLAGSVVAQMIAVAEERTKALEALLQAAANDKSSLDSKHTASASKAFFASSTAKRWDDNARRLKPAVDQLLNQLRSAERTWNEKADKNAPVDDYNLVSLAPVMVSVDTQTVGGSSLEKGAYNQTRTMYPWRRSYYDQYGQYTYR